MAGYQVEEDGEVIGIFTEHDLLTKVIRTDLSPLDVAIGDVMTPDPVFLRRDDSLEVLVNKMVVGFFHHVPIVDDDAKLLSSFRHATSLTDSAICSASPPKLHMERSTGQPRRRSVRLQRANVVTPHCYLHTVSAARFRQVVPRR